MRTLEDKGKEAWIRIRYQILVQEFGDRKFTRKDVEKVLEKHNKELANVNEFLTILSKEGLLESRKKEGKYFYRLIQPSEKKIKPTKDQILKVLKSGADIIRNREYRILLILLFYKALSDRWVKKAEEYFRETNDWKSAYHLTNIDYYVLYNENEDKLYTWDEVIKDKVNLINNFINALNGIADLNEKLRDLKTLVEKLGFAGFISNEDNYLIFRDLVENFNKLDLREIDHDILGDAYEWILSYFAPTKAKAGEVYTPREVIRLMVEALNIEKNSDVLDPACGSAAMLIEAYKYVSENYKDGKTLKLEGQEWDDLTAILGKLNLVIHGVENYTVYIGDSLINPKFSKADYVLANPPWNLDYDIAKSMNEELKKIYEYGITPKQTADWLWVQLMLYFARKKVSVVLDNGALFRGGKEKAIREKIIDKDLIECVILLPEKLFYNTGAPGIIMILNKNKPEERKNKILFINASQEFEKHPEVRKLNILSRKNIDKIVKAYREFKDIDGFCRVVDKEEIKENDYNLNVTLYVFPQEEVEKIDVKKEWEELKRIEGEIKKTEEKIKVYINELY